MVCSRDVILRGVRHWRCRCRPRFGCDATAAPGGCEALWRRSDDGSEDRVGRLVGDCEGQFELGALGALGGVLSGGVAMVATDLHEVARLEGADHLVEEVEDVCPQVPQLITQVFDLTW